MVYLSCKVVHDCSQTKINGVNDNIQLLSVDSDNNIYFGTRKGENDIFVLNYGNNISKK